MNKSLIFFAVLAVVVSGCAQPMNKTQKGSLIGAGAGAAVGAAIGQAAGHNTKSTLIGAGIGAALGGLTGAGVGNYMDKQEAAMKQELANVEGVSVKREMDTLALNFRSDLLFDSGSAAVKPAAAAEMGKVSKVLNDYPQTTLIVEGHSDSAGRDDVNQKLSEKRADSVKQVLVGQGVAVDRIATIGMGETKPVADNSTEVGRALNRRVNIYIKPQPQAGESAVTPAATPAAK